MKILHVTKVSSWNGEVHQLLMLAKESLTQGVDVSILCPSGSSISDKCKNYGIPFSIISKNKFKAFNLAKHIVDMYKISKFDILHIHSSSLLLASIISKRFYCLNTPLLLSKKSMINKSSFLSKIKYNHASLNKIICVSEAVKKSVVAIMSEDAKPKVGVVYDGIEMDLSNQQGVILRSEFDFMPNDIIVGNIANHTSAKNLEVFVETANYIVNVLGLSSVKFMQIGGYTKYTPVLLNKLREYNLENNLFFYGFLDNASAVLSQFDIMLMTSRREGLPLAIFESFKYKIPVVSTKAGGVPEAIIDGQNGMLAEIGDFTSLSLKIKTIIDDSSLKESIINNAFELLNARFSTSIMTSNTIDTYTKILK